jgi:hypothetical protein
VAIVRSEDGATVRSIDFNYIADNMPSIELGSVVARFGIPCRSELAYAYSSTGVVPELFLDYPTLIVQVALEPSNQYTPVRYRLRLTSPMKTVLLLDKDHAEACYRPLNSMSGAWPGFTSFENYAARFREDSGLEQP